MDNTNVGYQIREAILQLVSAVRPANKIQDADDNDTKIVVNDDDTIDIYINGDLKAKFLSSGEFYSKKRIAYGDDTTERTTTSTSYVDEPNLRVDLNVKAGDIISVRLEGWFKNDTAGESVTVYPYVYSGTTDDLMTSVYIAVYSTKYQQKFVERLYKAMSDGTITFGTKWRVSSGTGYGRYRGLIASVIGNDNY